jgi:hypothetical protein
VLSEGARVELECQVDKGFNGPEDVEDLDWFREKLRIEQNWLRLFYYARNFWEKTSLFL